MQAAACLLHIALAALLSAFAAQTPSHLKCENSIDPLGIDEAFPRLSWVLDDPHRGAAQHAYRILVASSLELLESDAGDLWDSGKVENARQSGVAYGGLALSSKTEYFWKVKTWDEEDQEGPFSAPASFETGMLHPASDWTAQWIGGDFNLLRKDFSLDLGKAIRKARAYVSSLGYNELYLNGHRVGDRVLNPSFTRYDKRALYTVYDVTDLLAPGGNAAGLMLGNAYYKNFEKPPVTISPWYYSSPTLQAILQLEVEYTDGTKSIVVTDGGWKALQGGPILTNHVFNGEDYDARYELPGWSTFGFDDGAWAPAQPMGYGGVLAWQRGGIRIQETLTPVQMTEPQPGVLVYDLGQNIAGWMRIQVSGPDGTTITLRHAELIHPNGMINPANLRSAESKDTYTLKGAGTEVYEPRFTYHGFRYVELTAQPALPLLLSVKARVVGSDLGAASAFVSSSPLLNQIDLVYRWSQRNNCMSIPTDTVARDERQGWGGDAVVTAEAALLHFDGLAPFYEKWMDDIGDCQKSSGALPCTAPDFHDFGSDTAWMSMRILVPWDVYIATGDERILERNYASMKFYLLYLQNAVGPDQLGAPAVWGDWLPAGGTESPQYFADAYYYANVLAFSRIAAVLGKTADAQAYELLAAQIRDAFNAAYLAGGDSYGNGSQGANAVALQFGLPPAEKEPAVLESLLLGLDAAGGHVTTGILGTKAIMEALWEHDRSPVACRLAVQPDYPGWGYMIAMGATTFWEHWEYLTGGGMNSHSHVMFGGGVASWIMKGAAGISPLAPGFEEILIRPEPSPLLSYAGGSLETVRGRVSAGWLRGKNRFLLAVTIPVNSSARVCIPTLGFPDFTVFEGSTRIWRKGEVCGSADGVSFLEQTQDRILWKVGSGDYVFLLRNGNSLKPPGGPMAPHKVGSPAPAGSSR